MQKRAANHGNIIQTYSDTIHKFWKHEKITHISRRNEVWELTTFCYDLLRWLETHRIEWESLPAHWENQTIRKDDKTVFLTRSALAQSRNALAPARHRSADVMFPRSRRLYGHGTDHAPTSHSVSCMLMHSGRALQVTQIFRNLQVGHDATRRPSDEQNQCRPLQTLAATTSCINLSKPNDKGCPPRRSSANPIILDTAQRLGKNYSSSKSKAQHPLQKNATQPRKENPGKQKLHWFGAGK